MCGKVVKEDYDVVTYYFDSPPKLYGSNPVDICLECNKGKNFSDIIILY